LTVRFALNTKQEGGQEACRESGAAQIRADSTTSVVEWMGGPGAKRSAGHEIPQETREELARESIDRGDQHRPWMRALDLLLISRLGGCLGDQERSPRGPRRFKADRTCVFSRNPARDCELSTNSGTDLDRSAVGPEFARRVHGHRHEREHAGREPIGAVNDHHRPRSPVRWEFRYPGLGIVAAYQPIRDPLTRSPQGKRTSG